MKRYNNYGRTKKEATHNKLFFNLHNAAEESRILGIPHIVYMGIQYFTQMAVESAPDKKEALKLINDIVMDTVNNNKVGNHE